MSRFLYRAIACSSLASTPTTGIPPGGMVPGGCWWQGAWGSEAANIDRGGMSLSPASPKRCARRHQAGRDVQVAVQSQLRPEAMQGQGARAAALRAPCRGGGSDLPLRCACSLIHSCCQVIHMRADSGSGHQSMGCCLFSQVRAAVLQPETLRRRRHAAGSIRQQAPQAAAPPAAAAASTESCRCPSCPPPQTGRPPRAAPPAGGHRVEEQTGMMEAGSASHRGPSATVAGRQRLSSTQQRQQQAHPDGGLPAQRLAPLHAVLVQLPRVLALQPGLHVKDGALPAGFEGSGEGRGGEVCAAGRAGHVERMRRRSMPSPAAAPPPGAGAPAAGTHCSGSAASAALTRST